MNKLLKLCDEALSKSDGTHKALHEACVSGHLRMSIPVNPASDHDLVISAQLERCDVIASALKAAIPTIAALRTRHDAKACERPDGSCYQCEMPAAFDSALSEIEGKVSGG